MVGGGIVFGLGKEGRNERGNEGVISWDCLGQWLAGLGLVSYSSAVPYGGTAPKFCMFHKRGPPPLHPVEHSKLRSYTSVLCVQWTGWSS